MRAIFRVSITGEANGALRNTLAGIARKYGFRTDPGGQSTGTWQTHNITEANYSAFVCEYWAAISQHQGPGQIDHIWSMIDRWAYPAGSDERLENEIRKFGIAGPQEGMN